MLDLGRRLHRKLPREYYSSTDLSAPERMPTLKDLLETHLAQRRSTVRALAEQIGMSYPTLLALVNKGHVPRKAEYREALRQALGLDQEAWARALAASGKDGVDPASAPRTHELPAAAERSTGLRGVPPPRAAVVPAPGTPSLATLVAAAARRQNTSLGVFARTHDLPYLSLTRLVATGVPPADDEIHGRLAAALGLTADQFAVSLVQSTSQPEPAQMDADANDQGTPLQTALRAVMERKGMTMKAFAELSELSVLTATRLVKHGALPSRATTHQKLRLLLDLSETDYELLLRRSQPAGERAPTAALAAGRVVAAIGADDEFQHRETEEITPHGEVREALAPRRSTTTTHSAPPADDELAELILRLNPRQKQALHQFLLSML